MSKVYKIGAGKRVYAIGDIHGYAEVLARMHEAIDYDLQANPIDNASIVYLGDYIDRGPDSKGVIELLMQRSNQAPHIDHIHLMGNHEGAMLEFLDNPLGIRKDWVIWGGVEAMQSYGVKAHKERDYQEMAQEFKQAIPLAHIEFIKNLKLMHVVDDYLFVHAGIQPGVKLEEQRAQDLIYTRHPFLTHTGHHEHRVVHGHTISKHGDVEVLPNRINLDSGLYEGGPLSCAAIEDREVRIIQVHHL